MKRCLVLLLLVLAAGPAHGQVEEDRSRNAAFVELLGNGGLYSLNYDRLLTDNVSLRAGFARWTADDLFGSEAQKHFTTVPLLANYLVGSGTGRLELGAGVLLGRRRQDWGGGGTETTESFVSLTGVLGYRHQPRGRGWMFRAGVTPFFGIGDEDVAYPDPGFTASIGLSGGYSF
jgi:hypothetical protein